MKVLICGSRGWMDERAIAERVLQLPIDAIVIQGGAKGADQIAGDCAEGRGLFVAEMRCGKYHWRMFGKRAGHMRNTAMLDLGPDLVIAFQRDGSGGTQGTIDKARERGIPVEVHAA